MTHAMPASPAPDASPIHRLLAMMMGTVQTQLICVAAQLWIADLLKDGPKPIATLAEATGTDASALARIMRTLTELGLVTETETHQFTCTPLGDLLPRSAVKPRRSGRGSKGVSAPRSGCCPLIFNILPNDRERCSTT
jgi:hypothetical protein